MNTKTGRSAIERRKRCFLLALMIGAVVWTGGNTISRADEAVAPSPEAAPSGGDDRSAYRIGAGDVLEIMTWKEPDFSRDVMVRLDGRISFPLLDDVPAAGLTPMELKQTLQEKAGEFIESPVVTVTVKNPASKKFYIIGEVGRTGEYPLIKDLTVLQAFALAGGFTEWASKKEILLLRRGKRHGAGLSRQLQGDRRGPGFQQQHQDPRRRHHHRPLMNSPGGEFQRFRG